MMTIAGKNLEVEHENGCQTTPFHGQEIRGGRRTSFGATLAQPICQMSLRVGWNCGGEW